MAESIARDAPDLLVTHFAPYAFPIARPRALPLVVHFHGPWAAESQREGAGAIATWAKRSLERAVYRRADRLIVLSQAFRDVLARDYGIDEARIAIVPGGVACDRFAPAFAISRAEARACLGWPTDRPIVLAVRRLASRMGLERLIEAMTRVRQTVPDALCLIAGRGRLEATLRERIADARLIEHVRLLGFVPDDALPTAYRAADLSIVPSESLEGFGLSAVESLAAGTPAIVTAVGGLPEVVSDLSPSLVVSPDVASLAASLIAALSDASTLPSSERCAAYARERFDWSRVAAQVVGEYRRVVDARRRT